MYDTTQAPVGTRTSTPTANNPLRQIGTIATDLLTRLAGSDPVKLAILAAHQAEQSGHPIRTEFLYPPIPARQFDWRAWYMGEEDEQMDCGWGATESEAICDLVYNYPRPR